VKRGKRCRGAGESTQRFGPKNKRTSPHFQIKGKGCGRRGVHEAGTFKKKGERVKPERKKV